MFFDIAGAFDKVYHNGLIYKLIQYKIPFYIINILINFLKNRKFTVGVGTATSSEFNITTGTPQGCPLSSILFSLFINDIPSNIKKNITGSVLFADDLAYFNIYKTYSPAVENHINKHLKSLESWLNKWRLKMAAHKCNYIVFEHYAAQQQEFCIKLYDKIIMEDQNPKFLGVRFDKHLNFTNQINYIKKVCIDRMNIIKILSNKTWQLTVKTLKSIYCTLVRSLMEYSAILQPVIKKTNFNMLQIIQNNCIRSILKIEKISIKRLHEIIEIEVLESRFFELGTRYVISTLETRNPLIMELINEYKSYAGGRNLKINTLLCNKNIY